MKRRADSSVTMSSRTSPRGTQVSAMDETVAEKVLSSSPASHSGLKSPTEKKSPCSRGRTMKDIEESLFELRRENFDLKMRIYLMEEQQEKLYAEKDPEELRKANAALKTQLAALKKDLVEKEDLILEAAKAMEVVSTKYKDEILELQTKAHNDQENYRATIIQLEEELRRAQQDRSSENAYSKFDDSSAMYALAFGLPLTQKPSQQQLAEEQIASLELQAAKLEKELQEEVDKRSEADNMVSNLQSELISLQEVHNTIQEELASHMERLCNARSEIDDKSNMIKTLESRLTSLEITLKEKESESWSVKEKRLTAELQKRLTEQEKLHVAKLQSKLEATKVENSQLQDQIEELRKRLNEVEIQNTSEHQSKMEILRREKNDLQEELKKLRSTLQEMGSASNMRYIQKVDPDKLVLLNQFEEKCAELDKLKIEYARILKTIQDLITTNKVLTKDLNIFKRKFGDLSGSRSLEKSREKNAGGDIPDSTTTELYKIKVQELHEELAAVVKERNDLSLEMEKQVQVLLESLKEKEFQIKLYEEKTEPNREKDKHITELQEELEKLKLQIKSNTESITREKYEEEKEKFNKELEFKKKEIEHLNEELRKRTFNLQELVNKELWDKNREIEKLNKTSERKQAEVASLKQQLNTKDSEINKLIEKIKEVEKQNTKEPLTDVSSAQNVDCKENTEWSTLIIRGDKGTKNQGSDEKKKLHAEIAEFKDKIIEDGKVIESLREECIKWKKESELAEKSRKELINACTLLTTRLEELATFLDSLLPSLGEKKRRMLQEAIERSREVSRSFSFSLIDQSNISVPILPDVSQVDFCSGDDSLDGIEQLKENNNIENDEVVRLRTQVESLVEKLKQRDSPEKAAVKSSPKRFSIWTLPSDSKNDKGFDLISLMSMGEGLALEDVTEGSVFETFDSDSKVTSDQERGKFKSSNSDEKCRTVRSSKSLERAVRNEQMGKKTEMAYQSESEGWSEPDRNVSMARIGIKEEALHNKISSEDSSSSFRKSMSAPSSAKKGRHEMNEVRRLNSKIRSLEQINCALRTELRAVCKVQPLVKADKAVSCQISGDSGLPTFLISEVSSQREKLRLSLLYNETIRHQLETAFQYKSGESQGVNIMEQLREMSEQLEQSCNLCLELESRCVGLENECGNLRKRLTEEEAKNKCLGEEIKSLKVKESQAETLAQEAADLRATLKEKENEALEKQCAILELRNAHLLLENRARAAETSLEEAKAKWKLLETASRNSEGALIELRAKYKEAEKQLAEASAAAERAEKESQALRETHQQETTKLRGRLSQLKIELEKLGKDHKEALMTANRKIEELTILKDMVEDEWKVKLECLEREKKQEVEQEITRRMDAEHKLVLSYEKQSELRNKLESEMTRTREVEMGRKLEERAWRRRVAEVERSKQEREGELRRKLDAATLTTSEAVLERTRLANDKLRLQHDLRRKDDYTNQVKSELEHRVAELEAANMELESRLEALKIHPPMGPLSDCELQSPLSPTRSFTLLPPSLVRQRSNPSSDYMSDQEQHVANTNNSNFWFPVCGRSNNNSSPDLGIESDQGRLSSLEPPTVTNSHGDVGKLEAENEELRSQLKRTRQALEDTLMQLTSANQKKRQVERAISRQLHKTHHILQKARVNLETHE